METENHFVFFELPVQFDLDEKLLRRLYLKKSKQHHPDFFTHDERAHDEALTVTAVINKAYETLGKRNRRIAYVLRIKGVLEDKAASLDPMFLMEMMEWNERIADAEGADIAQITKEYHDLNEELNADLWAKCKEWDKEQSEENLAAVKDFYLKTKYLLRIKEAIDKFADA